MTGTYPQPLALATPNVTSAGVQIAAVNPTRLGLLIYNPANFAIWIAPIPTAAVVSGAGSIAVQPQQWIVLGPPQMPSWTQGVNAVVSSGSTPVTVLEFYS